MGDLISRSDLYNRLVELETLARNRVLDTPINSPCYQRYVSQMNERTMFKGLVSELPKAYDVEKVVTELEKLKVDEYYKSVEGNRDSGIRNNAYANAIDIVKAGGVNNDN